MKNAVAEQKKQLSALQNELSKAEQGKKVGAAERKQLEAKLTAERADVVKLQHQLASLEKAREMVTAKAGMQAKMLVEQEAALENAKKEAAAREAELKSRDEAIAGLKKQLSGLQSELAKV